MKMEDKKKGRPSRLSEKARMDAVALRGALAAGSLPEIEGAIGAFGVPEGARRAFAAALLESWRKNGGEPAPEGSGEGDWPGLSEKDEEACAKAAEPYSAELPPEAHDLLRAMARLARHDPHPSGRIRYSDEALMRSAGLARKSDYRAAFAQLASLGLVRCAVVGSRDPFPTIELPWLPKAPEEGE